MVRRNSPQESPLKGLIEKRVSKLSKIETIVVLYKSEVHSQSNQINLLKNAPMQDDTASIQKAAAAVLPSNYNFEVVKTIQKIRSTESRKVGLQLPEGLLLFSCALADLIRYFTGAQCTVLGDVTYGACCVDDLGAAALGCDFLVHYGHSCLVSIDATTGGTFSKGKSLRVLYVFVDIAFDTSHLIATVRDKFESTSRLAIMSTIQFAPALYDLKEALDNDEGSLSSSRVIVPQAKPLSPGEVLGCTSPKLDESVIDALIFVADGRFHLESAMIHNPNIPAFRYDPYSKVMSREHYDTSTMMSSRLLAVQKASVAKRFGVILGTLGRQGSTVLLERLEAKLKAAGKDFFIILLSEISPAKLAFFSQDDVEAWVQIACPRLSIDWSEGFGNIPLLTPYECEVAIGTAQWRETYPMDFWAAKKASWQSK